MAIGAMGITKMAAKGGVITICLTAPLSVLECFLLDKSAWYQLAGSVGADFIKVGTASLIGAIGGILATGGSAFFACPPIGLGLEYIDARYKLTEELIELLKDMPEEADKAATTAGQGFWNVFRAGGLGMGGWGSIAR